MIDKNNSPLISVIVFGKKTSKLNENESRILRDQLYTNIDVVIIDSSDEFSDILTKMSQAKGEYLAFWSIENLMSCDYIRALTLSAIENDVDVVFSDVSKIRNGRYFYYNLDPVRNLQYSDKESNPFEIFKKYNFMAESIYLPWNKIIKKSLIQTIISKENLLKEQRTEKVAIGEFNSILLNALIMKFASNYRFVPYVYSHIRESNSDNLNKITPNLISRFDLCIKLICELIDDPRTAKEICRHASILFNGRYDLNSIYFKEKFGDIHESLDANERYFSSVTTELPSMFFTGERLKKTIASEDCHIVSFDIFDTLIVRPFSRPDDLFYLLSFEFNKLIQANSLVDFVYMRKFAEKRAREIGRLSKRDEISLKDIYVEFNKLFGVSISICERMMSLEIETELKMCSAKQSGHEFYKLAKYFKRKIIIISDIYLPQDVIEKILINNDYNFYEKLYISSSYDKSKSSGELFEVAIGDLNIGDDNRKSIVHIGDNYGSDFKKAKECGLTAFHINSAINLFKGGNSAVFCGSSYSNIYQKNTHFTAGNWSVEHYWGLRTFHGLVANSIFDYPFFAINNKSDFNADPKFVGYYCVGGLLLGLTRWLLTELNNKTNCTIHFVARDGWLLKQFYDKYTKDLPSAPKSNYLYVSRKSLFVADISSKSDLLAILNNKLVAANNSPRKIISLLKPLFTSSGFARVNKYYQANGNIDELFGSNAAYLDFIKKFTDKFYELLDFKSYRNKLVQYFSSIIKPGDVIFDVGYSGRTESILSSLLGFAVDSYYIHSNGELLNLRETKYGFNTKVFYQWRPNITGVVREHLLMEYAASIKQYDFDNLDNCKIAFGEFETTPQCYWFTQVIQNSALSFCDDFLKYFGNYREIFAVENYDLALPSEYFIQLAKPFDRKIFSALSFEDDIATGGSVNVCDFWDEKFNSLSKNLLRFDTNGAYSVASKPVQQLTTSNIMESMLESLKLPKLPALKFKQNRKNKILLYSNELSWSGAPRSLLRIAKVLLKHKYNVEVWSLYDGPLKAEYNKLNISVKIYDYNNADYDYAIKNFDLCIVNAAISYKFYYVISKFLPTVWYIREATNLVDIARGNPGLTETLQSSIDMVCVSEYAKKYIVDTYNKNVSVVPNCVEDKHEGNVKLFDRNKVVFTTLGTIEPRKGYDIIVEAVKLLPPEYASRIEFRIAGRVLDFCKDWANNLLSEVKKIDNIIYLGEITQEEKIIDVYKDTDIVVVASRDESCSLVALEGAMHAKPLIVTENTGAKYIVTDKNGLVVRTASARALADALMHFIDSDADKISEMGQVSRQLYENYASMPYYEKCILNLVEDKLSCPVVKISQPETNKPIIPIILATNQNYAPYVSVTIRSLLDNANNAFYYDIYVFYTELGKQTVSDLEEDNENNYRVKAVNITSILDNSLKLRICAHYSVETYYRFFAPEILPFYDKIIYLDCDMIVLDDISKLYAIDIGDCALGAVRNYMNRFVSNYVSKLEVKPENYFNAGLLIINTKQFIKANVREKAFKLLDKHEDFIMLDQDALNVVCKNNVFYISEDWNVQWHHFEAGCDIILNKQLCLDAYANPKVLHFTGKNKPWIDARIPKAHLFWVYAENTNVFYEIVKKMSQSKTVNVLNNVEVGNKTINNLPNKKGLISLMRRFFEVWESEGFNKAIKKIINKIKIKK